MSRRMVRSVTLCSSASSRSVVYRPASAHFRNFHRRMTAALRIPRGVLAVEDVALPELDAQGEEGRPLFRPRHALHDDARADLHRELAQRLEQPALDAAAV